MHPSFRCENENDLRQTYSLKTEMGPSHATGPRFFPLCYDSSVGLVVKAFGSRVADLDSIPAFSADHFPGQVIPLTKQLILYSAFPAGSNRLVGLVERHPLRERKIPGSNPACAGIFSGSSHTSDSKIGTPVAPLPGAWRYRVSTGTGRPGVSILLLGEVESLICNFYLSVAARKIV